MMIYFLLLLFLFNFYFYIDLISPPKINLIYPKDKEIFRKPEAVFKGYADKRGELFINNIPIYFDNKGYFEKNFFLKEGLNRFIIKERKFWGQETKLERDVIYLP